MRLLELENIVSSKTCDLIFILATLIAQVAAYYKTVQCYGTGECVITNYGGGIIDDIHKWPVECHDGEALVGLDSGGDWTGLGTAWCKFMFPKKKPSFGIYPYYEYCNVREITNDLEYYCYDRFFPIDTYDTFVTAYSSGESYTEASIAEVYKCCKLPHGYHLDYSRCEYKYTHDRFGEHYDEGGMWPAKCDRDFLLTGMGKAMDPWVASMHYVWFQCCPVFYNPAYVPLFVHANATLHRQFAYGKVGIGNRRY